MEENDVSQRVRDALAQIEAERKVRVLYACESGSRAWGFASRDSDYDVRFLYVHRRDWYLSVEDRRDVIEQPTRVAALRVARRGPRDEPHQGDAIVHLECDQEAAR